MSAGKRIGYIRVSTVEQNGDRQLDGMQLDKIFTDKASGKDTNRPEFQNMIDFVRDGDELFVHSMDRLARNLDDLRKVVKELTDRGVKVHFVKENLTFNGDDNPMSVLLLSVMGAFAEFERSIIKERQREGIEIAKKKGVYKGRKPVLSEDEIEALRQRAASGEKIAHIARKYGITRQSVYNYLPAAAAKQSNTAEDESKVAPDDLNACKRCGAAPICKHDKDSKNPPNQRYWYECEKCNTWSGYAKTRQQAAGEWNYKQMKRRDPMSPPSGLNPCKQCGGDPVCRHKNAGDVTKPRKLLYWYLCERCNMLGNFGNTQKQAAGEWNYSQRKARDSGLDLELIIKRD